MGLGIGRGRSNPYPLSLSFVSVVDQTLDVPGQEPTLAVEESGTCQATLPPVLEGSENKSWKKEEEGRGTEREGRGLVERERAKERVMSSAFLRASEISLGKDRRLTGTLKEEISWINQRSSPPGARSMISLRACAAALPGIVLPRSRARASG